MPVMSSRNMFRGALLGLLLFQILASAADGGARNPCLDDSSAVCGSFREMAQMSGAVSEDQADSSPSTSGDRMDNHCSMCPLCLSAFIMTGPVSIAPNDPGQRLFASADVTFYEAPSSSLLRPPIA